MAVIWRDKKGYKIFITPEGGRLTSEDVELAKQYDEVLQTKIKKITSSLKAQGFFELKDKMKKWYMLGKKLHFLDEMPLRIKCDPDLNNTFRVFYDLAINWAPKQDLPTDKERLTGDRNLFYVAYQLAKFPWELVKNIPWGNWTDIHAAFHPTKWIDRERLLSWVLSKSKENNKINRKKLRKALMALRSVVGKTAEVERDTTVLFDGELYKLLDQKFNSIK